MNTQGLRNSREFSKVYRSGKSFADRYLVLYYRKNGLDCNRIGFSVSKKVGKAVVRNRVKRLLKESYRLNFDDYEKGYDFVIIARVSSNNVGYKEINKSMSKLFRRIK